MSKPAYKIGIFSPAVLLKSKIRTRVNMSDFVWNHIVTRLWARLPDHVRESLWNNFSTSASAPVSNSVRSLILGNVVQRVNDSVKCSAWDLPFASIEMRLWHLVDIILWVPVSKKIKDV